MLRKLCLVPAGDERETACMNRRSLTGHDRRAVPVNNLERLIDFMDFLADLAAQRDGHQDDLAVLAGDDLANGKASFCLARATMSSFIGCMASPPPSAFLILRVPLADENHHEATAERDNAGSTLRSVVATTCHGKSCFDFQRGCPCSHREGVYRARYASGRSASRHFARNASSASMLRRM